MTWDVIAQTPPAAGRRPLGETRAVAPFCRHGRSQALPRPPSPPSGTPNDGGEKNKSYLLFKRKDTLWVTSE